MGHSKKASEEVTYDVIIIGAGPAGMTAAVYAVRKGLQALVVAKEIGISYQEMIGRILNSALKRYNLN